MYNVSYSVAVTGIDGNIIRVEADVSNGLPGFSMVGYLSSEVKEAKDRVWVACKNAGYEIAPKKITINLSPADLRKDGTGFDLAVAASMLAAYGYIPQQCLDDMVIIGELSLDGSVKPVKGILPMVYSALKEGFSYCLLPLENVNEGMLVAGINIIGIDNIRNLVNILTYREDYAILSQGIEGIKPLEQDVKYDFLEVRGQVLTKRAIEVAISGMHNLLMIGPPGSGKSMLAKRITEILKEPDFDEIMEISKIYSVAGLLNSDKPYIDRRPFRAPHHTITRAALVGGGKTPSPGEMSLASGGVLFLDELPEFTRQSIEVMRQPLEDGYINISRVGGTVKFPASCELIAAMNPCPCGYYPDRSKCKCTSNEINRYLKKVSRPILDRIDICTETILLDYETLQGNSGEDKYYSTELMRERIAKVHSVQRERYKGESFTFNAFLEPKYIDKYCTLSKEADDILREIFEKDIVSNRALHKILKVARTIADMDEKSIINENHIAEAVGYRNIDKKYWNGRYDNA
ncbi:MAG: YifB family Mg chelatase-like AAA ATPase [Lachnospiraceae bacterium]|nr:YifB family Mg chelatase-like AAA ATPase [Lachnospiraceae bacterium]